MLTPFEDRARRALIENPFFRALSDKNLRWIQRISVRKGELLFEKGAPSDRLHAVVTGQIKLYSRGSGRRDVCLDLVAPGEFAGVLGIAGNAPRHATAVALAHSELATIPRRDLEPLMARHPQLHAALSIAASDAARRLTRRLEDAEFLSVEDRVEKALVDLAKRFGERVERGTRIRLRQQDVADVVGLSRESVSKVLTSPAMRSRLQLGRGSILLVGV
jgi:CRP-like cAMP-binding protein